MAFCVFNAKAASFQSRQLKEKLLEMAAVLRRGKEGPQLSTLIGQLQPSAVSDAYYVAQMWGERVFADTADVISKPGHRGVEEYFRLNSPVLERFLYLENIEQLDAFLRQLPRLSDRSF